MWGSGAAKCAMKKLRSSSQEATEDSDRLRRQARGTPMRSMGNQLAKTLSSLPSAQMASSYPRRKLVGSASSS